MTRRAGNATDLARSVLTASDMSDAAIREVLLLALGKMIGKEASASQLLHPLAEVMREMLSADRGTIFLLDGATQELVSVVADLPELTEIRVPIQQGVAGWVARNCRMVNIPSCAGDARFWRQIDRRTGYTTRSMLAGPLQDAAGNLVGVVQLLNKREGIFTDRDEQLFATLTRQTAALLEETTLGSGPDRRSPACFGDAFNRIVGVGEPMRAIFRSIRKVAPTQATVLLRGESGTGKGLIARAIHFASSRREGPFVMLDCTALPEGLVENELFGHERGAFTGAHARMPGKVEAAQGGTLFLDEIGDLPPRVQGKLLTLLQDRTYCRVGSTGVASADVRIIAATNRPLEDLVAAGEFRHDLYYRLRVVQVGLPPLRVRGRDDLLRLINHFVAAAAKRHGTSVPRLHPEALEALLAYPWPGNVRELQNCLESAVVFAEGEISRALLPLPDAASRRDALPRREAAPPCVDELFADRPTLAELEARYIARVLEETSGNRSACARVLGIGRNTLLRKLKSLGLETADAA